MSEEDNIFLQQVSIIQQHYDDLLEQFYNLQNYTNEIRELLNEVLFNLGQNFRLLIWVEWIVILIDGFRDNQGAAHDVGDGHVTDNGDGTGDVGDGHVTDSGDGTGDVGDGHVTDSGDGTGDVGDGHVTDSGDGTGDVGDGHVTDNGGGTGDVGDGHVTDNGVGTGDVGDGHVTDSGDGTGDVGDGHVTDSGDGTGDVGECGGAYCTFYYSSFGCNNFLYVNILLRITNPNSLLKINQF